MKGFYFKSSNHHLFLYVDHTSCQVIPKAHDTLKPLIKFLDHLLKSYCLGLYTKGTTLALKLNVLLLRALLGVAGCPFVVPGRK